MQLPLILVDTHREVSVFDDPAFLVVHVEAVDVVDHEYRLFDCAGTEYELQADGDRGPVTIGHEIGHDHDFVRGVVTELLGRTRHRGGVDGAEIQDICTALLPYAVLPPSRQGGTLNRVMRRLFGGD